MPNEKIYFYRYSVNGEPRNWRDRLGNFLRSTASHIDKRESLGVRITSVPELSLQKKRECITFGFQRMKFAIHSEVEALTQEEVLREALPELYKSQS